MVNRVYFLEGGLGNQACIYAHALDIAKNTDDRVEVSTTKFKTFFERRDFELDSIIDIYSNSTVKVTNNYIHLLLYVVFKLIMKMMKVAEKEFKIFHYLFSIGYHQESVYPKLQTLTPMLLQYEAQQGVLAVHIRRGDYLLDKHSMHGVIAIDSFLKPINKILSTHDISCVEVISEGDEALDYFDYLEVPIRYRLDEDPIKTFYRMVNAECVICSNSTFSLLAASLGEKSCVMVPDRWNRAVETIDLAPDLPKYEVKFN